MDKNIKEIERRKLNKKVLKKTSGDKQINNKEIFCDFIKNCILLFTTFTLSDFIVERFLINSWFIEMTINVVLAVVLFGVGTQIMRYIKREEKS